MIMAKEKVNYQEVYDLYQLCSETKDLREFCADYGVNYDKFMNWQKKIKGEMKPMLERRQGLIDRSKTPFWLVNNADYELVQ